MCVLPEKMVVEKELKVNSAKDSLSVKEVDI